MDNAPTIFTALIFFIIGNITCHLYKRHIIHDLEDGIRAWRMQSEISATRLSSWKCLRPHISDIDNIESEVADFLGYTKDQLDSAADAQVKEIKDTFGI
jgi:hypothetical protein